MATGSEEKSKDCEGGSQKKKKKQKKTSCRRLGFLPQYLGHPSQEVVVRKWWGREEEMVRREKIGEGHR